MAKQERKLSQTESHIPQLLVPEPVMGTIKAFITNSPQGLETSVALFGTRINGYRVALFAVGPGPKAIKKPCFHQPDEDHLNRTFTELLETWPRLEFIGSLHVHPTGMRWLSRHDRRTVHQLLSECALPDFVAGIIQRSGSFIMFFPYFLSNAQPDPCKMRLVVVPAKHESVLSARSLAKGEIDAS